MTFKPHAVTFKPHAVRLDRLSGFSSAPNKPCKALADCVEVKVAGPGNYSVDSESREGKLYIRDILYLPRIYGSH